MSRTLDAVVSAGESVEVSERLEMVEVSAADDGYRVRAIYDDEPRSTVVLTADLGGEVDIHSRGTYVGFVGDKAVYILDERYYGE